MAELNKKEQLEAISRDLDSEGRKLVEYVQKAVEAQSSPRMTREFRAIEIDRLIALLQLIKLNSVKKELVETKTLFYEIEQSKLNQIAKEIYSRTYGPLVSFSEQIDFALTYLAGRLQREIHLWKEDRKRKKPQK